MNHTCNVNAAGTACITAKANCSGYTGATAQADCTWAYTDKTCIWNSDGACSALATTKCAKITGA